MNLFNYTYDLVRQIPPGRLSTYGAVAEALGDKVAARAVGRMMNQNPDADTMPCFKIVHADGTLGGFGLGVDDKIRRLCDDHIQVRDGRIVDFESVLFTDFDTNYPLRQLRKQQLHDCKQLILEDDFEAIETVAGVDVAYPKNEFRQACASCVVMNIKTKQVVEEQSVFAVPEFPYIPTYLFFREFPLIERVVSTLKQKPSVFFVDGNGILHPNQCGIASHAGVLLDLPTVGVAKNLLTGDVKDSQVYVNGEFRGYTLYPTPRVTRPLYISPGHRISAETSLKTVKMLCQTKHPEPLRRAHIRATQELSKIR